MKRTTNLRKWDPRQRLIAGTRRLWFVNCGDRLVKLYILGISRGNCGLGEGAISDWYTHGRKAERERGGIEARVLLNSLMRPLVTPDLAGRSYAKCETRCMTTSSSLTKFVRVGGRFIGPSLAKGGIVNRASRRFISLLGELAVGVSRGEISQAKRVHSLVPSFAIGTEGEC